MRFGYIFLICKILLFATLLASSYLSLATPLVITQSQFQGVKSLAEDIKTLFPHDQYFYLCIGKSPSLLQAYFEATGVRSIRSIPLSKISTTNWERFNDDFRPPLDVSLGSPLDEHIEKYFPNSEELKGRAILLVDYVRSGDTLVRATQVVKEFVLNHKLNIRIKSLGLIGALPILNGKETLSYTIPNQVLYTHHVIDIPEEIVALFFHQETDDHASVESFDPRKDSSPEMKDRPQYLQLRAMFQQKVQDALKKEQENSSSQLQKSNWCLRFLTKLKSLY